MKKQIGDYKKSISAAVQSALTDKFCFVSTGVIAAFDQKENDRVTVTFNRVMHGERAAIRKAVQKAVGYAFTIGPLYRREGSSESGNITYCMAAACNGPKTPIVIAMNEHGNYGLTDLHYENWLKDGGCGYRKFDKAVRAIIGDEKYNNPHKTNREGALYKALKVAAPRKPAALRAVQEYRAA